MIIPASVAEGTSSDVVAQSGHGVVLPHVPPPAVHPGTTVPAHAPPALTHTSPVVHESPSSQLAPAPSCTSGKLSVASSHAPW